MNHSITLEEDGRGRGVGGNHIRGEKAASFLYASPYPTLLLMLTRKWLDGG